MDTQSLPEAAAQCRRLEERLRVLSEATRAFAEMTIDSQRLLDGVAKRVAEVIKDYCIVQLLSDDGKMLVPAAAFDSDPEALGRMRDALAEPFLLEAHSVTRRVIETGEPFLASGLGREPAQPSQTTPRFFDLVRTMGIHSVMLVPLRVHDRSIGLLILARFRGDSPPFDARDLELAQCLADHAALAVTNARLLTEARREERSRQRLTDDMELLAAASREFAASTDDYVHLIDVVARRLGERVGDMCIMRAMTEDGEWLESTGAVYHRDPALIAATREVMSSGRQRVGHGISGRVAASGQPILTPRISPADFVASSEPQYRAFLERLNVSSSMTLPLLCRGKVVGVANLMRSNPSAPYDDDDLHLVQSIADHAALAIGNARSYAAEREARGIAEKATSALRHAETRFARLRDAGVIGILVSDLEGNVVEANDEVLRTVGYSRDDILSGRVHWASLSPVEWQHVDTKAVDELQRTGVGNLREKEYIRKDGTRVPVLIGSALVEGNEKECISFVLDLTERKNALAAVEKMRVQHAAEAHLAAIVEASADAIIGKTLEGIVTSWNDGAEGVFGYSAEEMVGRSISRIIPPGREWEEASILEAVGRGEVIHFDAVRRRKDGRDIDVSVTSAPVRDATGRIVGISKVARDITDRRRAEEALARAKDAAEASSRELEAFSYSVAHDLRAPLRGMNGFAQVLLEDYADKLDAEGRDCIDEICMNARKMGGLIDGLLVLSRVTRADWRPERIDLSALAQTVFVDLAKAEPLRHVAVVIADHVMAYMDPSLARALFENLLGNAWKFTSGTPDARIEFGATDGDGERTLFVRDNGAGFDMAHTKNLFAPFQRLHTVAEFPGTGIGLATVQRIVHRHGGRIWADGKVGAGATFSFTLPDPSREAIKRAQPTKPV